MRNISWNKCSRRSSSNITNSRTSNKYITTSARVTYQKSNGNRNFIEFHALLVNKLIVVRKKIN